MTPARKRWGGPGDAEALRFLLLAWPLVLAVEVGCWWDRLVEEPRRVARLRRRRR